MQCSLGLAPEKASRIIARDTQTTWPDPWSLVETDYSLNCFGKVEASTKALGSVNAPPPLDHRDSGVGWSRKES